MDQTEYTTFINTREHLALSQQDIADIAKVDVALVEQYEKGELLPPWGHITYHEKMVLHEGITRALFVVLFRRYPEQFRASRQAALDEAKKYPEGSIMRIFFIRAGNISESFR